MYRPKDWITAGGVLGLAILTARATKTPLASILAAMPFLLKHLKQWENAQSPAGTGGSSSMTREEAALILGVGLHASEKDVQDSYRRLMQKNHPDLGGTDYLAAKINQARDILLKQ